MTKNRAKPRGAPARSQSLMMKDGLFLGASDPRRPDAMTIRL